MPAKTMLKSFFRFIIWLALTFVGGTLLSLAGMYLYLSPALPSVESLKDVKLQTPLRVYSADHKLIGEFGEQRRTPIQYKNIPKGYIDALLAAEDEGFYSHNGVSIKGLVRAASHLLMTGEKKSGGSTITMQVTREFFLHRKKHFRRKFNEILLAIEIEKELSKAEILELYVNMIFLGNRAYGIQAAAEIYYGKSMADLSIAQVAMIAGLQQAPSINNPIANPSKAKMRRDWILSRMYELGKIDKATMLSAQQEPVTAEYHRHELDFSAPYVAELARQDAIKRLGKSAYTDGYRVYTSINSKLQAHAQSAVAKGLHAYDLRHGYKGPELRQPNATPEDQLKELKQRPSAYTLKAALIEEISENSLTVRFRDDSTTSIDWSVLSKGLRLFVSENRTKAAPQSATELFNVGDIIRLEAITANPTDAQDETNDSVTEAPQVAQWRLSQIPEVQAALVSIDAFSGDVLALIGGYSFDISSFNRAVQAKRQPGSNFKPFLYTAALENNLTPATLINDAPIVFDDDQLESTWRPENSSGKFYGPTRLRKALYLSRNLVSIRVLRTIGINAAIKDLDRFNVNPDEIPKNLSLALGSYAMTPFDVASGYAVFANGGYKVVPSIVSKIDSDDGTIIFQKPTTVICHSNSHGNSRHNDCDTLSATHPDDDSSYDERQALKALALESQNLENNRFENAGPNAPLEEQSNSTSDAAQVIQAPRVIAEDVAYLMDSMLKDVVQRGTARKAKALKRTDVAGKTGTTNGPLDAWFSGYAGGIATTAWVGFDENQKLGIREFGGSAALPIWIDYMSEALKNKPQLHQVQPSSVVAVRIDPETGERARTDDPDAIFEVFRVNNAPKAKPQSNSNIPNNAIEYHEEIF
ncbi:penicillin-binding protein 1A [Marinagarivorans algicola]|uniref:penicillin-binding protein 1A n=1 Tax=Marinagarivorans algicola TaxID=1513270 RepID=UPI001EE42909|nr:PBP1A family penicillin-binding protein [Marinagarivorans algicola]